MQKRKGSRKSSFNRLTKSKFDTYNAGRNISVRSERSVRRIAHPGRWFWWPAQKTEGFKPNGVRWNQNSMEGEERGDFRLEQNRPQVSGLAGDHGELLLIHLHFGNF